jgi:hypothetical protein
MATRTKRLRLLGEALASIPEVECKGLCWESCGPVPLSGVEVMAIEQSTGASADLDPEGLPGANLLATGDDLRCRYLSADHRCTVYAVRPLICRVFGVAAKLPCPHGCVPKEPMPEPNVRALIDRVRRI